MKKNPDELVLASCETGTDAVLLAKKLRSVRDANAVKMRIGT